MFPRLLSSRLLSYQYYIWWRAFQCHPVECPVSRLCLQLARQLGAEAKPIKADLQGLDTQLLMAPSCVVTQSMMVAAGQRFTRVNE